MKWLIVYLLLVCEVNADNMLTFQDFRSNTVGNLDLTETQLSAIGPGTWSNPGSGDFTEFKISSNAPFTFHNPIVVNGVTYTTTGTKWLHMDRGGGNTNNANLDLSLSGGQAGETGGNYQYTVLRYVVRMFNTNLTSTGVNFDQMAITDNPECVCQNQTGGAYNFLSHAVNGANGGWLGYTPGNVYEIMLISDKINGTCNLTVLDSDGNLITHDYNGGLTGSPSAGVMPAGPKFNNYLIRINSSYLDNGLHVTGYVEFGGISVSYQNTVPSSFQPAPFR